MSSIDAQGWLVTEKMWEYIYNELMAAYEVIYASISHVLKKQRRI